jgi:preprotein translocase subunit SecG
VIITVLLLALHILVCFVLILVVLLQTGKRADLAGAFGGGGSQSAFGARGAATFLSKATAWSAGIFMVTSILLGMRFGRETTESVVKEPTSASVPARPVEAPRPAPGTAVPAEPTPAPVPVQPPPGTPNTENPAPAGGAQPATK